MAEPVTLYGRDGAQTIVTSPSEVQRLIATGDWGREPLDIAEAIAKRDDVVRMVDIVRPTTESAVPMKPAGARKPARKGKARN